jgi:hypothetical protein
VTVKDLSFSRLRVCAVILNCPNERAEILCCGISADNEINHDSPAILTRRDVVTDRQIRLFRDRNVIKPYQLSFLGGSTVAAAHKVGKEIKNMKE